jgi:hypothetical protein
VLTARFRALEACEPRQIREEAALSNPFQVPRVGLARASDAPHRLERAFDRGCVTGLYRSKSGFGCAEAMTISIGIGLEHDGGEPTPAKPASAAE